LNKDITTLTLSPTAILLIIQILSRKDPILTWEIPRRHFKKSLTLSEEVVMARAKILLTNFFPFHHQTLDLFLIYIV